MSAERIAVVRIKDLALDTILGVHEHERRQPRRVLVNLKLEYDAAGAVENDDVLKAVDYEALTGSIAELARASEFRLVESLAAAILDTIGAFEGVQRASVEVSKPGAVAGAETVTVRMCSGKS